MMNPEIGCPISVLQMVSKNVIDRLHHELQRNPTQREVLDAVALIYNGQQVHRVCGVCHGKLDINLVSGTMSLTGADCRVVPEFPFKQEKSRDLLQ